MSDIETAQLRARLMIEMAAAKSLLAAADVPTLLLASKMFIDTSEEAARELLFSPHPDAAAQTAQAEKDRWTVEFAKAVAARAGSSRAT